MEFTIGNEINFVLFKLPPSLAHKAGSPEEEWNDVVVRVSSGAWKGGEIKMSFLSRELEKFLKEFSSMLKDLGGEATLESLEEWMELKMEFEKNGSILVTGSAKDAVLGNRLHFTFESDQSYFSGSPKKIDAYLSQ